MPFDNIPQGGGIYLIRNLVNGKVYVGLSYGLRSRWSKHVRQLRSGKHSNPHLQSAWGEYGESSFSFEVIKEEQDRSKLPHLERAYIFQYGSFDRERGYNLTSGGDGGYERSFETRAKIGAANRGKVRTPEMRNRMKAVKAGAGKGRVKSEQEIANLKAAHARRKEDPNGYAVFQTPEARSRAGRAGRKAWSKVKGRPEGNSTT